MAVRIAVDFNTATMEPEERVVLPAALDDALRSVLQSGLPVILYDETLEVEAVVELAEPSRRWLARPDWATSRDLAPLAAGDALDHRRLTADD